MSTFESRSTDYYCVCGTPACLPGCYWQDESEGGPLCSGCCDEFACESEFKR